MTAAKGKLHLAYNETVIQLTCQSKMMETRRMDIFKLMKKNKKMSAPHSNFSDNINHDWRKNKDFLIEREQKEYCQKNLTKRKLKKIVPAEREMIADGLLNSHNRTKSIKNGKYMCSPKTFLFWYVFLMFYKTYNWLRLKL